ncbi:very long chain fatty acid elongase AAEL008004-like isoform X1 [Linepithema humile]|uniref:very long chain fatty acid elongase AAEL008004-like isoform X1 n=2 Tax=Linepithema humile TaxID=83485 RepID=UPI00351EFDCE
MGWQDIYNYYILESSKPLTRNWLFISSPFEVIFITLAYLYFVLRFGPRYMKNKPPYKLKTFILVYNIIQILANIWVVKEHISSGWFSKYTFLCFIPHPTSPSAIRLFNMMWWFLLLKFFDYFETCIFVLRKKQNQVSSLHVYHHVSNVAFAWYFLKYMLDERATFVTLINCSVHVIMYIYYFLAAWSSNLQKSLLPIKPYVTRIQLMQFFAILLLCTQVLSSSCEARENQQIIIIFNINILIFIYLFYNFYKKNYILPKLKQQ